MFNTNSVPGTRAGGGGGGGGGGCWLVDAYYCTAWNALCHCYTTLSIRSFTACDAVSINADT